MMIQPELFSFTNDLPHNDTQESKEAAKEAKDGAAQQRASVLSFIRGRGFYGATRDEIGDHLGLDGNSVRPRVWELLGNNGHDTLIRQSELRRKSRMGRNAGVLVAI
jgi:hypothetical protein